MCRADPALVYSAVAVHSNKIAGTPAESAVRRLLLALLLLGVAGTTVELLLLGHDEDAKQIIPLAASAATVLAVGWHLIRPGRNSIRTIRAAMVVLIVAGLTGVALHSSANAEFQREVDPGVGGQVLFWKIMRAKAPPALAPGVFVQLGLLGLVFTYRHPALYGDAARSSSPKEG